MYTVYLDLGQKVIKLAKDCEFLTQSPTQILVVILIQACLNAEMNKWLSDNLIHIYCFVNEDYVV